MARPGRRGASGRLRGLGFNGPADLPDHDHPATNRYARHHDSLGSTEVVAAAGSALLRQDATWRIVPGLAGSWNSFQSRNFPGHYLRHQNYRVRISPDDGSALMRGDATWCARSAPTGVRLSSVNFPGSYLRHSASELWPATPGGPNTWDNTGSLVPDIAWSVNSPWAP